MTPMITWFYGSPLLYVLLVILAGILAAALVITFRHSRNGGRS